MEEADRAKKGAVVATTLAQEAVNLAERTLDPLVQPRPHRRASRESTRGRNYLGTPPSSTVAFS